MHREYECEQHDGDNEPRGVDFGRIEDCDDRDSADVVDDGEREQEELQWGRDAISEKRHDAEGEGNVGGDRNAPTGAFRRARVEGKVEKRRGDHAADCRNGRQGCGARRTEFSDYQLTFDFETDNKEEDRDQAVVYKVLDRFVEDVHIAKVDG